VIICIACIPVCVHIDPLAERVLPETLLSFALRVRAKAPLRITIVIGIQHNGGVKGITGNVCLLAFSCNRAIITPKVLSCICLISTCGTHAWG